MDRHKIWRIVRNNLETMKREAPEGHVAVVEVFIVGRTKPIRLNRVETSKEPEFAWVFLSDEVDSPKAHPDDQLILVPEHHIERVEIRFVRSEETRAVGFSFGTLDGED
jgi:hypothetical protein